MIIKIIWMTFVTTGAFFGITEYLYNCKKRKKMELEILKTSMGDEDGN